MDESGHKVWCPSDLKLKAQALLRKNSHETTLRGHRHVIISANIKHVSTNVNISNHKKIYIKNMQSNDYHDCICISYLYPKKNQVAYLYMYFAPGYEKIKV